MSQASEFAATTMLHHAQASSYRTEVPQHPALTALSRTLGQVRFVLKEIETDPLAEQLRTALYRARLNAASSTLQLSHPLIWTDQIERDVQTVASFLQLSTPGLAVHVDEAIRLLRLLQLFDHNPIQEALQADLDRRRVLPRPRTWPGFPAEPARWALVVRPALAEAMQAQWADEEELAVLTPSQLTGNRVFEHLYLLGAAHRYPAALLASPHALGVTLYRYSFMFDQNIRRPLLQVLQSSNTEPVPEIQLPLIPAIERVQWLPQLAPENFNDVMPEALADIDLKEPDEVLSWQDELTPAGSPNPGGVNWDNHQTLAREVMVETLHGRRALLIDEFQLTSRLSVHYPPTVEATNGAGVKVGDVLLLRNEGTQLAYSRELARSKYDAEYLRASELMVAFKTDLHTRVQEVGTRKEAVKRMVRAGADRSCTVGNLSQWFRMTTFRPDSEATYVALLEFSGWAARRSELDAAIQLLRSRHILAGKQAGDERLALLLKLDFSLLDECGYLSVELGGGQVSAHRVVQVQDTPRVVATSTLGQFLP
ncbi:hypothetical protein [Deinococcus soli (ex Cha et al. 2016)]|uniref:Uncharacterized protein n=2 Tax=Deinococcus soli (ex Cha et al. 2016) TaxID=1309411 RepID=A0AAE3XHG3_9DEIO|nr:hypothetical protein [Deinococcus soli (ex Cha et al. 2016)]MDR6220964.1 hypothetical protein [Deinococcus soli (ex Cha et al. 2016)]MDR6330958.1 hypothetical protein [Deinococcus soli (ex Cha et al. 2016)]MDR6753687.1 hypothetical protein [Deinococcus soli (ex Cha et al. 2016)]